MVRRFWLFSAPGEGLFLTGGFFSILGKKGRNENFSKIFIGSCRKTSQLSKNIFWASCDHVVAQKSIFWKKIFEKVANAIPPLVTFCRDISRIPLTRGGLHEFTRFLHLFSKILVSEHPNGPSDSQNYLQIA